MYIFHLSRLAHRVSASVGSCDIVFRRVRMDGDYFCNGTETLVRTENVGVG